MLKFIALASIFILPLLALPDRRYIFQSSPCGFYCSGTPAEPFPDLITAITYSTPMEAEYIFIRNPAYPYNFLQTHTFGVTTYPSLYYSLTIRPLFCDDDAVIENSTLANYCYNHDEQALVYIKEDNQIYYIFANLTIKNIIFDGSENVYYENINRGSTNLPNCFIQPNLCCNPGQVYSDVLCGTTLTRVESSGNTGIFWFPYTTDTKLQILTLNQVTIRKCHFRYTGALFLKQTSVHIKINNLSSYENVFPRGHFRIIQGSDSDIFEIDGLIFKDYNPKNLVMVYPTAGFVCSLYLSKKTKYIISNSIVDGFNSMDNLDFINSAGNFVLINSTFSNIQLSSEDTNYGNAIFLFYGYGESVVENCLFKNITLFKNTRFIVSYSNTNQLNFINSRIENAYIGDDNGQAQFFKTWDDLEFNMTNVTFSNIKIRDGYVFYIGHRSKTLIKNLTISDSEILDDSYRAKIFITLVDSGYLYAEDININNVTLGGQGVILNIYSSGTMIINNINFETLIGNSISAGISALQFGYGSKMYVTNLYANNIILQGYGVSNNFIYADFSDLLVLNNFTFRNYILNGANIATIESKGSLTYLNITNGIFENGELISERGSANEIYTFSKLTYINMTVRNVTYGSKSTHLYVTNRDLVFVKNFTAIDSLFEQDFGLTIFLVFLTSSRIENINFVNLKSAEKNQTSALFLIVFTNFISNGEINGLSLINCSGLNSRVIVLYQEYSPGCTLNNTSILNTNPIKFIIYSLSGKNNFIDGLRVQNSTILNLFINTEAAAINNAMFYNNIHKTYFFQTLKTYNKYSFSNHRILDCVFEQTGYIQFYGDSEMSNISFEKNTVFNSSGVILAIGNMSIGNLRISDNIIDEYSTFVKVTENSILQLNQVTISDLIPKTTEFEKVSSFIISLDDSKLFLSNGFFSKFSQLISLSNSEGVLSNVTVEYFTQTLYTKSLFYALLSKVQISDFYFDGKNETLRLQNFFLVLYSQLYATRFTCHDFVVSYGQFFQILVSELYIFDSNFTRMKHDNPSQSLVAHTQGSMFLLEKSYISDCGPFYISTYVDEIQIQLSNFSNAIFTSVLIDISSALRFSLSKTSIISDTSLKNGQLIHLSSISNLISIMNSSIRNTYTSLGAVRLEQIAEGCLIDVGFSTFYDNIGDGINGAVFTMNMTSPVKINFLGNEFVKNSVYSSLQIGGLGGAIYFDAQTTLQRSNFVFQNNTFSNNSASLNGGAIYIKGFNPSFDNSNKFNGNKASGQNSDIGSHAIFIDRLSKKEIYQQNPLEGYSPVLHNITSFNLENIYSGQNVPENYVLALYDAYGNIVLDDSKSILRILDQNSVRVSNNFLRAQQGIFQLKNLTFISTPGINKTVSLSTNSLKKDPSTTEIQEQVNFDLHIKFLNCGIGQVVLNESCYVCPFGTFQLNLQENYKGYCEGCKIGMNCLGGENVVSQAGYYRLNKTANLFFQCPNPDACLGGRIVGDVTNDNICKEGYKGNLCGNCIDGYGRTRDGGDCYDCLNRANVYALVIFIILLLTIIITLGVKLILTLFSSENEKYEEKRIFKISLLRIFFNFMQTTALIKMLPIKWPDSVQTILNINASIAVVASDILSLDCLFARISSTSSLNIVFVKLILFNLLPWTCILIGMIYWVIYYKVKGEKVIGNKALGLRIRVTAFVIILYFQLAIINEDINIFSCINLYRDDNPIYFMTQNYDIKCWEGQHLVVSLMVSLPSIILWGFLLPIYAFYKIRKMQISTSEEKSSFTFLTIGYKGNSYFWELFHMLRKYLIILAITTGSYYSKSIQAYFTMYSVWLCMLIQLYRSPFVTHKINQIEIMSSLCFLISSTSALVFEDSERSTSLVYDLSIAATVITNIVFIMDLFKFYLRYVNGISTFLDLKNKIMNLRRKEASKV